jgi:hypothetical protein
MVILVARWVHHPNASIVTVMEMLTQILLATVTQQPEYVATVTTTQVVTTVSIVQMTIMGML